MHMRSYYEVGAILIFSQPSFHGHCCAPPAPARTGPWRTLTAARTPRAPAVPWPQPPREEAAPRGEAAPAPPPPAAPWPPPWLRHAPWPSPWLPARVVLRRDNKPDPQARRVRLVSIPPCSTLLQPLGPTNEFGRSSRSAVGSGEARARNSCAVPAPGQLIHLLAASGTGSFEGTYRRMP